MWIVNWTGAKSSELFLCSFPYCTWQPTVKYRPPRWLQTFQTIRTLLRLLRTSWDCPKTIQADHKFFRPSKNSPTCLETFESLQKLSRLFGAISRVSDADAQKLSGWHCLNVYPPTRFSAQFDQKVKWRFLHGRLWGWGFLWADLNTSTGFYIFWHTFKILRLKLTTQKDKQYM